MFLQAATGHNQMLTSWNQSFQIYSRGPISSMRTLTLTLWKNLVRWKNKRQKIICLSLWRSPQTMPCHASSSSLWIALSSKTRRCSTWKAINPQTSTIWSTLEQRRSHKLKISRTYSFQTQKTRRLMSLRTVQGSKIQIVPKLTRKTAQKEIPCLPAIAWCLAAINLGVASSLELRLTCLVTGTRALRASIFWTILDRTQAKMWQKL